MMKHLLIALVWAICANSQAFDSTYLPQTPKNYPPHKLGDNFKFDPSTIDEDFIERITAWENIETVKKAFSKMKSWRLFEHSSTPHFKRRANWLEPDDRLCYFRAAIATGMFVLDDLPPPTALFLEGGFLSCSAWPDGGDHPITNKWGQACIAWDWHTAPAVRVGKNIWVLDPALNYNRPLSLKEWYEIHHDIGNGPPQLKMGVVAGLPFQKHYGFRHMGSTLAKIRLKSLKTSYQKLGRKGHPLGHEFRKVSANHSPVLLNSNPPWLGSDLTWKKTKEFQFNSTCQKYRDFTHIQLHYKSNVSLIRLHIADQSFLNNSIQSQIKSFKRQTIQFNLKKTLGKNQNGQAVLGGEIYLELTYPDISCEKLKKVLTWPDTIEVPEQFSLTALSF